MSARDDGGPAFPVHAACPDPGMTLRDWLAGQALANPYAASESCPKLAARWAYDVADAMLAVRAEGRSDDK